MMVSRPVLVALALAMAALAAPSQAGPARADNIGGLFEECAQLVEFVPPSGSDDGHLTLVGIGPGLYNPIGDETHHRFPFGPDISVSSTLAAQLAALANDDSFTCLRMTGDGMGLITAVALDSQVQVCGTIASSSSGIFSINRPADAVHMELIAEAETIVDNDLALNRILTEVTGSQDATCLNFQLDGMGLIDSITVDTVFSACGRIEDRDNLVVGSFVVANIGSTTEALIPEPALTAALVVLPRLGSDGCVQLTVVGSRITEALLGAGNTVCGSVIVPDIGDLKIDGLPIPRSLLTSAQLAELKLAVGGTACLWIWISANDYGSSLTTNPPTPSPTPSASPLPTASTSPSAIPSATRSATPSASPSATTSATPREIVAPPTESDGPPTGLLLGLVGASAMGLGGIGYFIWRRMQGGGPAPLGGAPGDQPVGPSIAVSEIAPFTPREQEVLAMLYEGMSNKEIGSRLFITESTAGVHVSNIMMKLGAKSRAEAAALAHRMGLLSYGGPQH